MKISLGEHANKIEEIERSSVFKDYNKNLRKIESLISPINNPNISQIYSKFHEFKRENLEKISEMSNENYKENNIELVEVLNNAICTIEDNLNINDQSLLKEFIIFSKNNNSLQIKCPEFNNKNSNRRNDKVTNFDLTPSAIQTNRGIINKYKHLFEDIEVTNNPKTGRSHTSYKRFFKKEDDVSDFTSFRNNANDTNNLTDFQDHDIPFIVNGDDNILNEIKGKNKHLSKPILYFRIQELEHCKDTIVVDETTRNE